MSDQPWWAKPGGAPTPGQPYRAPQPAPRPTPQPAPPRVPQYSPPPRPAPAPPPPATGRSVHPLVWAGLAVVVAAVAVVLGVVIGGGGGSGTELDVAKAEAGVAQILSDPVNGYGANDVGEVECNEGRNPAVEAGAGFGCDVEINGNPRHVEVVFTDDKGTFAVDGPR